MHKKIYDNDNIFNKIIAKNIASEILFEDDLIIAISDIKPVAPVHILIIPKKKYIDYADFISIASNEEISYYFKKINDIAQIVGIGDNYRLVTNIGPEAGQSVFHFHTHLLGGKIMSDL